MVQFSLYFLLSTNVYFCSMSSHVYPVFFFSAGPLEINLRFIKHCVSSAVSHLLFPPQTQSAASYRIWIKMNSLMHTAHDAQVSLQTKTLKQAIIFPLWSRLSDRKSSKYRSPPHNHYNNNTNNNSNKHSQFISHWGGVNIYIRFFSPTSNISWLQHTDDLLRYAPPFILQQLQLQSHGMKASQPAWFIDFETDGAAAAMGLCRGAATLLCGKINPDCHIHRINLRSESVIRATVEHIADWFIFTFLTLKLQKTVADLGKQTGSPPLLLEGFQMWAFQETLHRKTELIHHQSRLLSWEFAVAHYLLFLYNVVGSSQIWPNDGKSSDKNAYSLLSEDTPDHPL